MRAVQSSICGLAGWFFLASMAWSAVPPAAPEWRPAAGPARVRELAPPPAGAPGFSRMAHETIGVLFTNQLARDRQITNQIYLNGSGVAAADVDGDGWCDLYFAGLDGPNALYRNLGNWQFTNVTAGAGVACANLDATGVAFADLDGDRDFDLVVNSIGQGTEIWLNDGKGHFTRAHVANEGKGGMSLAIADIDGDGRLDVYVVNYRTSTLRDQPHTKFRVEPGPDRELVIVRVNDRPVTEPDLVGRFRLDAGKIAEDGEVDVLLRNTGAGHFEAVPFLGGQFLDETGQPLTSLPYDWGLSAMFRDLNGDRAPDLYVCNDFSSPDRAWRNDGSGRFQALPRLALRSTSLFSMGLDVADINRDGYDDLFVVDMLSRDHARRHNQLGDMVPPRLLPGEIEDRPQYTRNMLYVNRGDGTYAEAAQFARLDATEWSWTPIFLDVDLDGYEDLLVTTGHERDATNADMTREVDALQAQPGLTVMERLQLRQRFPRLALANVALRNLGNLQFADATAAWGFSETGVSHGMALADLDNDGDLDVIINNLNAPASLYRNNTAAPRLAVRLRGEGANTFGIGSRIIVEGGSVTQAQEMVSGGRYLSSDDPMRTFAAFAPGNRLRIRVEWRSGKNSVLDDARAHHAYEIAETAGPAPPRPQAPASTNATQFVEGEPLPHRHHEEAFDDFARQPLLPRRLSQNGPGLAWFDIDGDGWEELLIGSGKGGALGVFRNNLRGGFTAMTEAPIPQRVTRDQTAIVGWTRGAQRGLVAGSANYEDSLALGPVARIYDFSLRTIQDYLPGQASTTGPLVLFDADLDGDLDLFVGGRCLPGRYPQPASSLFFRWTGERWERDETAIRAFTGIGMISGATASDLNQDGIPELILACDHGPIRILEVRREGWRDVTVPWGLDAFTGWWNGVATGDFDGDGMLDLVAGNWGLNHSYQSLADGRLTVFYGSFEGAGMGALLETYPAPEGNALVSFRDLTQVSKGLPFVRAGFARHGDFGAARVEQILGTNYVRAQKLEVQTFASMIFLNRTNRFEARLLPDEAQLSPVFGVVLLDFDGDAREDLFLSQNFFGVPPGQSRLDAGLGLLLRGDGTGGFSAVSPGHSGIRVFGEQRGAATADFDHDGRPDLAVTQNGGATRIFRNTTGGEGLRVRLNAGPDNPEGIGATVRLVFPDRRGPLRQVHAGGGYWSQDSSVVVLGLGGARTAQAIVRFPGGRPLTVNVPANARGIEVSSSGAVTAMPE